MVRIKLHCYIYGPVSHLLLRVYILYMKGETYSLHVQTFLKPFQDVWEMACQNQQVKRSCYFTITDKKLIPANHLMSGNWLNRIIHWSLGSLSLFWWAVSNKKVLNGLSHCHTKKGWVCKVIFIKKVRINHVKRLCIQERCNDDWPYEKIYPFFVLYRLRV